MWGKAIDFLRRRKHTFQLVFGSVAGQEVLRDLAKFCRANQSCFHEDPRLHAVLEGRREVWLRIERHLNLTSQELYQIYGGRHVQILKGDLDETQPED